MAVQEAVVGTEAGKLQKDLRGVFRKMLSHARTIDMTLTLGAARRHWDRSENLKHISREVLRF